MNEWLCLAMVVFQLCPQAPLNCSKGQSVPEEDVSTLRQTIVRLCAGTDLHNGSIELILNALTQALHPPRTLQHRSLCPLPELTSFQITVWELPGDREQFINTASLQKAKFNNTFPTTCLPCRSAADYCTECPTVAEIDRYLSVTEITRKT